MYWIPFLLAGAVDATSISSKVAPLGSVSTHGEEPQRLRAAADGDGSMQASSTAPPLKLAASTGLASESEDGPKTGVIDVLQASSLVSRKPSLDAGAQRQGVAIDGGGDMQVLQPQTTAIVRRHASARVGQAVELSARKGAVISGDAKVMFDSSHDDTVLANLETDSIRGRKWANNATIAHHVSQLLENVRRMQALRGDLMPTAKSILLDLAAHRQQQRAFNAKSKSNQLSADRCKCVAGGEPPIPNEEQYNGDAKELAKLYSMCVKMKTKDECIKEGPCEWISDPQKSVGSRADPSCSVNTMDTRWKFKFDKSDCGIWTKFLDCHKCWGQTLDACSSLPGCRRETCEGSTQQCALTPQGEAALDDCISWPKELTDCYPDCLEEFIPKDCPMKYYWLCSLKFEDNEAGCEAHEDNYCHWADLKECDSEGQTIVRGLCDAKGKGRLQGVKAEGAGKWLQDAEKCAEEKVCPDDIDAQHADTQDDGAAGGRAKSDAAAGGISSLVSVVTASSVAYKLIGI